MFSPYELQTLHEFAPRETQAVAVLQAQVAAATAARPDDPDGEVRVAALRTGLQQALSDLQTALVAAGIGPAPPATAAAEPDVRMTAAQHGRQRVDDLCRQFRAARSVEERDRIGVDLAVLEGVIKG